MPHILKNVGEWMNLEFAFIREPMDAYGGTWNNNTYTGMVGMLYRNEVDLIMNPILTKDEFLEFMYLSNPITIEAFTILSGKTLMESGSFYFFSVLDTWVWAGILIAMLSIAFVSASLLKTTFHSRSDTCLFLTGRYCWMLLSTMLKQTPRKQIISTKQKRLASVVLRILTVAWVFCIAFLVMNVFQSLLVSKMTLRKSKPLVDTLSDLASCKDCDCLAPKEIMLEFAMKNYSVSGRRHNWQMVQVISGSVQPLHQLHREHRQTTWNEECKWRFSVVGSWYRHCNDSAFVRNY